MEKTRLRATEPIVVSVSRPGETRWGYYQFPALSRLPDGRILLTYADAEDASETHGEPAPALVSTDGVEWSAYDGEPVPIRPHFSISQIEDGEYLICPASRYFDVAGEANSADRTEEAIQALLPEPSAVSEVYGTLYTYRLSDMPPRAIEDLTVLRGARYSPGEGIWKPETIRYQAEARLAWRRSNSSLLPRPFFERPLTRYNGDLLYPDYRVRFELPDGRIAAKGYTTLMASTDNGRTFERRGVVAVDTSGHDLQGEPTLEITSEGDLVCVVRRADQVQKPMGITWSSNGGKTWSPAHDIFSFGVFPCLLRLDCGVLLLSYGRPGVHIAGSSAGNGRIWDTKLTLIEGDPAHVSLHTCGYTNMLPMSDNRALLVHSDFDHIGADGAKRKAICVREIVVE